MLPSISTPQSALADWPFIRGAHFNGHSSETEITDRWSDDGPPVLWTRQLGQGYSAFVAQEGRVYTQAQNMTGQYLYCLNADSGDTIWEHWYDWPYESAGVYPGPRGTPTLWKDRVYFTSPDGLLGCLDSQTGDELWTVDLSKKYGIRGCDFGYSCSPTLIDEMVILPVGGSNAGVVAFDATSGRELWRSTNEPASYTPAYPIELGTKRLVVCYMQNSVVILHRETGELLHQLDLSHGYDEHSAWPIYVEPNLWLSGPFKAGSYTVDISTPRGEDPKSVWRTRQMSNDVCSSVLVDGHIYGFDIFDIQSKTHRPSRGVFRCLEFSTGEEKWSHGSSRPRRSTDTDEHAADIGQCGIIAADGKLIILNELGELIILKVNPEKCVELARCTVLGGELTWTPPCLQDGRLYIRNQSRAMCVYVGTSTDILKAANFRANDLPQRQYHNLAALILAVEPEYAFDVPHNTWLVQWFVVGSVLLVLGKLAAAWIMQRSNQPGNNLLIEFVLLVILGAVGTTILGHLTEAFVFTWPVCLYASLEYAVGKHSAANVDRHGVIRRRIPLFVLVLVGAAYFLICRRLSLVFEWAFLVGYAGALPCVWILNRVPRFSTTRTWTKLIASQAGFTFFFAAAVAFLKSRY